MNKNLALLMSLVSLPLVGAAQASVASPHFYVGAGASLLTNAFFNIYDTPRFLSPSLTGGLQLSPHWAIQIGAALGWRSSSSTSGYYSTGSSAPDIYTYEYRSTLLAVPVLGRYTFGPATKRIRVDGLGGITFMHSTNHNTYTTTSPGKPVDSYQNNYSSTSASLTLGPGVRYALSPHVELAAHGLLNAVISDSYYRFSDRLLLNFQVGAHYTFGQ